MPTAEQLRRYTTDPLAFITDLIIPGARGSVRFADAMASFQRDEFTALAPALLAVANGEKPPIGRYWWERTKGGSKDSDLACSLLWLLAFTRKPLLCQVGAADQDQADELRKAAADILRLNLWLAKRVEIQRSKILCDGTNSEVEIVAADTHGSHGARPDVVILNELSHVTKQEFAENLLDNAAKVPHGLVVVATNAGFTGTWQWRWRELARLSANWRFHKWDRPAPWLDSAHIAEAERRNTHARFSRLFWGVWCGASGDALNPDDVAAAVVLSGPMEKALPGFGFAAGLDLGIKNDHASLAAVGKLSTGRLRLASLESWAPRTIEGDVDLIAVENAVLDAHRRFRFYKVGFDPYQCALMAQRLIKAGVPMEEVPFSGKTLNELATVVLNVFRSRGIDLYPDDLLLKDLGRLTITEKSYGYKLEATRDADGHADRATALALAMHMARSAPVSSGIGWGGTGVVNRVNRWAGYRAPPGSLPLYGEGRWKSPFIQS